MKPYKNIKKPNHTIYTHCFVFFVDDGKKGKTFIHRDLETDFYRMDYNKYIYNKEIDLHSKYDTNVEIEGSRLGLWEYEQLLELGVPKL